MKRFGEGIPKKVLKDIFPKRLIRRSQATEEVYTNLKRTIRSRKLKKGQKLTLRDIAQHFNVSIPMAHKVISQLKEDGFIIYNGRRGFLVAGCSNKGR